MLTQENLRSTLAAIFDVDESFVIPKQGTWWNAQDSDPTKGTWIAYLKKDHDPRVLPAYQRVPTTDPMPNGPILQSWVRSTIELQIVGSDAELLASSVILWLARADVMKKWDDVDTQMFASGFGRCQITPFIQAGVNTVLAYNVTFEVLWALRILPTLDQIIDADVWSGDLTVEA